MENLNQVDDMVCEYLLFRGFTKTFKAFEDDREHDMTKGFNVDKIVLNLFELIHAGDYDGFKNMWSFLSSRFFSLLDNNYVESVDDFWNSFRKLYVVTCIRNGKKAEVLEFFSRHCVDVLSPSQESERNDAWRRWCSLPFLPKPEQDSYFMQYFSNSWEESLKTSFRNFLRAIFQNLSPPPLLGISIFKTERQHSQAQLRACKSEITLYRERCERANELASKVIHTLGKVQECVTNCKAEDLQAELKELLRDVPTEQLKASPMQDSQEVPEISPFSRPTEVKQEETPVHLEITKKEEVGVFSENINRCQWSRDGLHFAAGGGEGVLSVYDFDTEVVTSKLFSSYGCSSEILAMDWSYNVNGASSSLLLFGLQGGSLGIFNAAASGVVREVSVNGAHAIADVVFSPQMNTYAAATVGAAAPMMLWDVATGNVVLEATALGSARLSCLEYLPNGAGVVCGDMQGRVKLFDARSGKVAADEKVSNEAMSGLRLAVGATVDGSAALFSCSTDGLLKEFDIRNLANISFTV